MSNQYVEVNLQIKYEDIIDVLTTALEGGSNYWYYIIEECNTPIDKLLMTVLTTDKSIKVYDVETDELLGHLCRDSIKSGLKQFLEVGCSDFDPAMDADEADVFFQYVVMGEVVFG